MQRKTKIIVFVAIFGLFYFSSILGFSVYADVNVDGDQSCATCATSPDQLITYTKFVTAILGVLQSSPKIDFNKLGNADSKQGQVNVLTDYLKQESDSYLGVVEKEGKILGTNIQVGARNIVTSFTRDFLADFGREFIVGAKSTAYVRDLKKLEEVDNWIDKEAIQHINNYVFNDPLPQEQYIALKQVFSNYNQIFIPLDNGGFDGVITYKSIVGWLNFVNRTVKNHITFSPKGDRTRFETSKGVNYTLNPEWSKGLASSYDCVRSAIAGNCNPTRGKTSGIAKEFGKDVGADFDKIMGKFQGSIKKLKQVFSKNYYHSYFDGFGSDWGVRYDGQNIGKDIKNAIQPRKDASDAKKERKALLDECFKKAEENPGAYQVKRVFSVFNPQGKTVSCVDLPNFEYPTYKSITEAEASKRNEMLANMNNRLAVTMNNEVLLQNYGELASPIDVSKKFMPLSTVVYESKDILLGLIENSINGCLAYCSNLNTNINCGSK